MEFYRPDDKHASSIFALVRLAVLDMARREVRAFHRWKSGLAFWEAAGVAKWQTHRT